MEFQNFKNILIYSLEQIPGGDHLYINMSTAYLNLFKLNILFIIYLN